MIACRVFMAPTSRVIASTYCENLLALVSSRVVVELVKSDNNADISVRYLSLRCVH